MSTKSSIAYQKDLYHVYSEAFDDDAVYLTLFGEPQFTVKHGSATLRIPVEVWAVMVKYGHVEYGLADMSDEELLAIAEKEVDKRIAEFQRKLTEESVKSANLFAICGCLSYGAADSSRESQLDTRMVYLRSMRDRHKRVKTAIDLDNTEGPTAEMAKAIREFRKQAEADEVKDQ
jgi:hypothetical protein